MYGVLDVSTSGLVAQRTRMNVISANLANSETILNAQGEYAPYRRRFAILGASDTQGQPNGVHVEQIETDYGPLSPRYEPTSPYADASGYVYYPNVNPVVEQMDAMLVARSYEANIMALEASKAMLNSALQMIA